jgi:hypothetical protein
MAAVTFVGDYIWLRVRMLNQKSGNPFDSVHLERVIAIQTKSGLYNLTSAPPEDRPCVHSIFPHVGLAPCWYVKRLNDKPIFM